MSPETHSYGGFRMSNEREMREMSTTQFNPTSYIEVDLKTKPEHYIVVEYKRYDEDREIGSPDGWVFYCLTPDKDGSETPFSTSEEEERAINDSWEAYSKLLYRGRVDGWMRKDYASTYRANLGSFGFVPVPWIGLSKEFRSYVLYNVLPLGWQDDEEFCVGRTTIWVKGELP